MKKMLSRTLSAAFLLMFILSVPAFAASSDNAKIPAQETMAKEQTDTDDNSISPAVIAVIFILPVVSVGLTIGTAVIVLRLHKPSPPAPEDQREPENGDLPTDVSRKN
ncbi:hypothetical protein [Catenibacillus scindens]|uniref:hypothetical protein n=1 Tax=Catenibacillus scindens TaxID=673271 RepID=UPI003208313D